MSPPVRPARPGSPLISSPIPSGILRGGAEQGSVGPSPLLAENLSPLAILAEARAGQISFRAHAKSRLEAARSTLGGLRTKLARKYGLSLSYSPVNEQVFDLTFSGAMAGLLGGRVPTSTSVSGYVSYALSALAWAEEFDTLWDSAAALDLVTANLMYGESYAVWEGRGGATLVAAECAPVVAAIIVSILSAAGEIAVAGITPGIFQHQTYVSTVGPIANVDLSTTYASVIGGAFDFVAHGGEIVVLFTSNPGFSAGQANQSTSFRFLFDGDVVGNVDSLTNPTASLSASSFAKLYRAEPEPGVHTFDVQAFTSATPDDAQAADNLLVITEYT